MKKVVLVLLLGLGVLYSCGGDSEVVKGKNGKGGNGVNYAEKVFIKGGSFIMENDFNANLQQHQVTVGDFYIGKYEVTNAQYAKFMNAIGVEVSGRYKGVKYLDADDENCQIAYRNESFKVRDGKENYPVIEVTWFGAKAYAEWVGGRLPTEAEWEYASRGGNKSKGFTYSGSNTIMDVAWYNNNSGKRTHEVGTKQANELGIYDMSGNVWEWCSDNWHDDYEGAPTDGSSWDDGSSRYRVIRGGGWDSPVRSCRVDSRVSGYSYYGYDDHGFRVVFVP